MAAQWNRIHGAPCYNSEAISSEAALLLSYSLQTFFSLITPQLLWKCSIVTARAECW